LATALVIPASFLVFLPINVFAGVIVAITLYVGSVVLLVLASPVIEVTDTHFIAGRARMPLSHVGEATGYHREEASLERGQRLNARAWMVIRGWVDPVVKVVVLDDRDPAPYWLISTRQPSAVISALSEARTQR
jgi:hypothetical protein